MTWSGPGFAAHAGRWAVASALLTCVVTALAGRAVAGAAAGPPGSTVPAGRRPPSGVASVGPLFPSAGALVHYCTASVVDSPHRDVLVTAAHCISGTGTGLVFVPGYDDGREPYGAWTVVAAYGAPAWLERQDPHSDVAFLVVAPRTIDGHLLDVQQVTGGNRLGAAPPSGRRVTVVGYALGSDDPPIVCSHVVSRHDGFPAFDCDGFVDGTSGGPWLAAPSPHGPEVVGVIGGLHQGGCRADVSYSSAFGRATVQTFQRAERRGPPSAFPAPGPDGCAS